MMKLHHLTTLVVLASTAHALQFERSIPGVVSIPFEQRRALPALRKRDGKAVDLKLGSLYFSNIINITVGTPPQPITLSLDTGSSDTILLHSESSLCMANKGACPNVGYYNANKSSSYKYLNSGFEANFGFSEQGSGSGAKGDVATDNLGIGGVTLTSQQLALSYGNSSTISFSILGLGYASGENQVHTSPPKPAYDNLPLAMAAQGATNLALFSYYKDSVKSHFGHLLFGGINQAQYSGPLVTLPVQGRDNDVISAFDITLQSVEVSGNQAVPAIKGPFNVVLDCGSSGSILSDEMTKPIFEKFDVTYFQANDSAVVDCALKNSASTIDFHFDGITISAPIASFVVQFSGNKFCSFGITSAGARRGLLGDNFLSSAYVVFDVSNDQISLGVRNFTSTDDNIVAVPKGGVKAIGGGPANPTAPGTPTSPGGSSPTSPNGAAPTTSKPGSASSLALSGLLGILCVGFTALMVIV